MAWAAIQKTRRDGKLAPNLPDYEVACASFSWDEAARAHEELYGEVLATRA